MNADGTGIDPITHLPHGANPAYAAWNRPA
jgi:hypothetical protein